MRSKEAFISVGAPLDVQKTVSPSQEDIDTLHQKFVNSITNLFEEQKWKYLADAERIKLKIV